MEIIREILWLYQKRGLYIAGQMLHTVTVRHCLHTVASAEHRAKSYCEEV